MGGLCAHVPTVLSPCTVIAGLPRNLLRDKVSFLIGRLRVKARHDARSVMAVFYGKNDYILNQINNSNNHSIK